MSSKEINLCSQIAGLLAQARKKVVNTINQTIVYTYYEIGRMIVEDEQQGAQRAEYGKKVLKELSAKLTENFGKGFSVDNLERMKKFYQLYSFQISATVLRKFQITENNTQIFASKYQTVLPSKEELRQLIENKDY